MSSRAFETAAVVVIAVAILLGGGSLMVRLPHFMPFSGIALLALGVSTSFAMIRSLRAGGPMARLAASRDIAFLAAIVSALVYVTSPQRWAFGAAIASCEFGLALEIMSRVVPPPRQSKS